MPSEAVQPLRINKFTPSPSPNKMSRIARPLSEVGPTERRRNSPSYMQATKKMIVSGDSSPFEASPLTPSTYALWRKRDPASPGAFGSENEREYSPSSQRRSSIENLKKASRVKNSNMFAREHKHEYDPASMPIVERPLAAGRPLSDQLQDNESGGGVLAGSEKHKSVAKGHRRAESSNNVPIYGSPESLAKVQEPMEPPDTRFSPGKIQESPAKSSLSAHGRFNGAPGTFRRYNDRLFDEDDHYTPNMELTPRSFMRHAKSVTFDAAPPQVNEYDAPTPDPSSIASGSREGSYEAMDGCDEAGTSNLDSFVREDSFDESLEDTDKTPVVLPEDWRHMSPEAANTDLADTFEDPFHNSSNRLSVAGAVAARSGELFRTNSTASNSENRPLPPLPSTQHAQWVSPRSNSKSFSASAGHISGIERALPSLPGPAAAMKPEISRQGDSSKALSDQLKLLAMHQSEGKMEITENSYHISMDNTIDANTDGDFKVHEDGEEHDDVADLGEYKPPPRISRESILRNVRSNHLEEQDNDYDRPNQDLSSRLTPEYADLDPDYPIPSREASSNYESQDQPLQLTAPIKIEDEDQEEVDLYSIPEVYIPKQGSSSRRESYGKEGSVVRHQLPGTEVSEHDDDEHESRYSPMPIAEGQQHSQEGHVTEDQSPSTPTGQVYDASKPNLDGSGRGSRVSLPDFASFLTADDDFKDGFRSFLSTTPPRVASQSLFQPSPQSLPRSSPRSESGSVTPQERFAPPKFLESRSDSGAGTPDSVIRRSSPFLSPEPESPTVPEPVATVRAPGGKLKTRPSATPADLKAMVTARRQASGQGPPSVSEMSSVMSSNTDAHVGRQFEEIATIPDSTGDFSILTESLVLDVPVDGFGDGLGLGLDEEFERIKQGQKVPLNPIPSNEQMSISIKSTFNPASATTQSAEHIPGQGFTPQRKTTNKYIRSQKGYLMRQNTKVVVATSRKVSEENEPKVTSSEGRINFAQEAKSAGNSPRKASHERVKSWTTEPWNGKIRRKSVRLSMSSPQKSLDMGAVPPLPGRESAVTGLSSLNENESFTSMEDSGEGAERGRLFVKVVGVKDLDLSLPRNERTYFQLTLDNGLHCVTTAWLELGRNAPIGQEFELVVFNELEFQLTLQTKLKKPPPEPVIESSSPIKGVRPQKSASAFSRVFTSPKKRKELERKQQEEEERLAHEEHQRQLELQARARARRQPSAWDLLHDLVASDGSFARAYICLKNHEHEAFGRQCTVDVPLFNEWTVENVAIVNSVKSKRGGVPRRPPYRIGKLELQLFYVPKPKGATEEDMPKSMSACIKEIKEAGNAASKLWEGYLSQQGGDCPYWRRRFFKLCGSKLTAYHETTLQPRATISLAKATKLIDDRTSLTQKETSSRNGGRRKSAFAEEEEGYMFVEEGFRIRFANGETIDFYADDATSKEGWMKVLSETIGKESREGGKWTDLVLAKERVEKAQANKSEITNMPPPPPRTSSHAHPFGPPDSPAKRPAMPTEQRTESQSRGVRGGSQSAPTSPMKSAPMAWNSPRERRPESPSKAVMGWRAPTPTSAKLMAAAAQAATAQPPTPLEKSPRHLLHAAMTGVAGARARATRKGAGSSEETMSGSRKKRDAIRSMIF